jgi:hypothetical protein
MVIDKELGYYTCNGLEFDSKIQAAIYANQVKNPIVWHFNNEVFDNYDWSIEPEESLDTLYDQRARELRESYDYVILSYSGGADSHNILMSFIRQGLLIDEIIVNVMTKGSKSYTVIDSTNTNPINAAAEHDLQTVPRLKEVEHLIPRTKITILDLTDNLIEELTTVGDASWILNKKEGLNPLGSTRFNYLHFIEVRKRFDKEKKVCLILGIEKPRTFVADNVLHMRFSDRSANIVTVAEYYKEYTNSKVEFFYWSPKCCRMLAKQAHTIKHFINAFPEKLRFWKNVTPEKHRLYHERVLRTLLYTTWDREWYQADKAIKDWYSEFDTWFLEGYAGTTAHSVWLEGIEHLKKNVPSFMLKVHGREIDGLSVLGYNYPVAPIANVFGNDE